MALSVCVRASLGINSSARCDSPSVVGISVCDISRTEPRSCVSVNVSGGSQQIRWLMVLRAHKSGT